METAKQFQEQQEAIRLNSKIISFVVDFQIGTLLNKFGIRKMRGAFASVFVQCHFYTAVCGQ